MRPQGFLSYARARHTDGAAIRAFSRTLQFRTRAATPVRLNAGGPASSFREINDPLGCAPTIHETHSSITKRLRRAEGHLHRVITMFADGRSCLDLAQQLYAVERAIAQAKKQLIRDHVDHCLEIEASEKAEPVTVW